MLYSRQKFMQMDLRAAMICQRSVAFWSDRDHERRKKPLRHRLSGSFQQASHTSSRPVHNIACGLDKLRDNNVRLRQMYVARRCSQCGACPCAVAASQSWHHYSPSLIQQVFANRELYASQDRCSLLNKIMAPPHALPPANLYAIAAQSPAAQGSRACR